MTSLTEWLRPTTIRPTVYTPGDLERTSGLTVDMQRVWRRRGQLLSAAGTGHARFTALEVLAITIRTTLSRKGIVPSETVIDLDSAAKAAMFHAVFWHGAVEVIGAASEVDEFLRRFEQDNGELGKHLIGNPPASSFLVINDQLQTRIVDEPEALISDDEEANIIYSLRRLGQALIERSRKPLVTVQWPDVPPSLVRRRLTGLKIQNISE